MKKINFEKKKLLPLIKEELKSHQDARNWYIVGIGILKSSKCKLKKRKVRDHCNYAGKYREV